MTTQPATERIDLTPTPGHIPGLGVIDWHSVTETFVLYRPGLGAVLLSDKDISDLGAVAVTAYERELSQVWIMPVVADMLGLPDRVGPGEPEAHPWVTLNPLQDAEVKPGHGGLSRWFRLTWRDGAPGHLDIVLPHLDADADWKDAADGLELIDALRAYKEATGSAFHWSVGSTASGIASYANRRLSRTWKASKNATEENDPSAKCAAIYERSVPLADPAATRRYRSPIRTTYARSLTIAEKQLLNGECGCLPAAFVYGWDVNAQYLGAIGAAICGRGEPMHLATAESVKSHGIDAHDPASPLRHGKLPGYFRLSGYPTLPPAKRHFPAFAFAGNTAGRPAEYWVTSPLLEFMIKEGCLDGIHIVEAWVWGDSFRPFEDYAAVISKARSHFISKINRLGYLNAADAIAYRVVKQTYSQFYKWIGRTETKSDKGLWRPDWSDIIADLAKVNLWRKIITMGTYKDGGEPVGMWPLAMKADLVLYVSAETTHRNAQPLGMLAPSSMTAGTFKPDGWADLADVAEVCGDPSFWRTWRAVRTEGARVAG